MAGLFVSPRGSRVREDQKTCPKCGGHDFTKLGDGAMSALYELVPAIA